jgi:hypothetical protein
MSMVIDMEVQRKSYTKSEVGNAVKVRFGTTKTSNPNKTKQSSHEPQESAGNASAT